MDVRQSTLLHKIAPASTDFNKPKPAIILLHGRGANEDDLLGLAPFLDPRFFVVAARAPFLFPHGGATWYDMLTVGSPEPRQFMESYEKLVQFVDDVKRFYPVDPHQLYLLGFSMGTVMSYAYALTHPEAVRGVVAHSGYVPEDTPLSFAWDRLKGKSFFVAHGTEDPVIGVEFARRARQLLSKTEATVAYHEYALPHSMSEESVQDFSQWLHGLIEKDS